MKKLIFFFIMAIALSSCSVSEPGYTKYQDGWNRSGGYKPTRNQWRTYKQGWRVANDCPATRGKIGY